MNPALLRTKVSDKMPLIRDHKNCSNNKLRFSRIRQYRGRVYIVHVCNKCGYEVERNVGGLARC